MRDDAVLAAGSPGLSSSKSYLVSVVATDASINLGPGLYALTSAAGTGVGIVATIGAAAVIPTVGAGSPQAGIFIPAGESRTLWIDPADCTAGVAALHHIASAIGPSSLWIVFVRPL